MCFDNGVLGNIRNSKIKGMLMSDLLFTYYDKKKRKKKIES